MQQDGVAEREKERESTTNSLSLPHAMMLVLPSRGRGLSVLHVHLYTWKRFWRRGVYSASSTFERRQDWLQRPAVGDASCHTVSNIWCKQESTLSRDQARDMHFGMPVLFSNGLVLSEYRPLLLARHRSHQRVSTGAIVGTVARDATSLAKHMRPATALILQTKRRLVHA